MRKMSKPTMEVIRFKNEDVIVSSFRFNHITISGFNDDNKLEPNQNGIFTYEGSTYNNNNLSEYRSLLVAMGITETDALNVKIHYGSVSTTIGSLHTMDLDNRSTTNNLLMPDGEYEWIYDNQQFNFKRQ